MTYRSLPFLLSLLCIGGGCSPSQAAQVSNTATLEKALESARGGETITLAPGEYDLALQGKSFASPVIVTSASRDNPAHIATVRLAGVQNLTLRNLTIGRALNPNEPGWTRLVQISESKNIVVDSAKVHGSLDGNPQNDGVGLFISDSAGITVTGSEFQELFTAVIFTRASDLTMSGNRFHDLGSDGSDFSAVTNVTIDGNCFTSFFPAKGDHPDAIQFWNHSVPTGSSNIRISNNQVFQGRGAGMQGVFIGSEEPGKRHRDITIRNNLVYVQDQYNGIGVADTDHVTVERNTVVSIPDDKPLWIALWNDTGAQVIGNVADRLVNDKSEITKLDNNLFLDQSRGKFRNLKAGVGAVASDLVVQDRGFQGDDVQCQTPSPAR